MCTECTDHLSYLWLLPQQEEFKPQGTTLHGSVTVGDADCTELMCTSAVGLTRDSYGYESGG